MYFNLELILLNFFMYLLIWRGENDEIYYYVSIVKYSFLVNDKGIFVFVVEISCLVYGTCIGYFFFLILIDNVRFENSMFDSVYGNINMYNF